jgi:HK97 family phage major capsid protein
VLVFPTGTVPANEGIFGDLSGYTLYVRDPFRVDTSEHVGFVTDQVAIRVSRRVDGVLSQAGRMVLFG